MAVKRAWAILVFLVLAVLFPAVANAVGGKILYVNSYHPEYDWSADVTAGVHAVLDPRPDIELRTVFMDTKRHQSEAFKKEAAAKVRSLIETWHPDVVITADDNAAKYLIVPYYRGTNLPFVFCGLNWDASVYGFPAANVTGMVEVNLFPQLVKALRPYARGPRVTVLGSDTLSERKEFINIKKRFGDGIDLSVCYVKNISAWEKAFADLQEQTDILILNECQSLQGYDPRRLAAFVRANIKIPTGAVMRGMERLALMTYAKVGEEQGEYVARTALDILNGAAPADFPLVTNKKARIYLNMPLAAALGIKFPVDLLANAHIIDGRRRKLLYVNSYHREYPWSAAIEKGLLKALDIQQRPDGSYDETGSDVEFRALYMDTKRHHEVSFMRAAGRKAREVIEKWRPDIVVTSDDAAAKYLIAPYYRGAKLPFVFCGVNWSAKEYGLPTVNVTGMIEVKPVRETIAALRQFAAGDRLGYLGADNPTNRKNVAAMRALPGVAFRDGALVNSYDDWRREYLRLQKRVDMLIWLATAVVPDWDEAGAQELILNRTRIPSGALISTHVRYTLLGQTEIGEEQGWWSGRTALRILDGTPPNRIPVTTNKQTLLYLNMKLARRLGVKFPMSMVEKAVFVGEGP